MNNDRIVIEAREHPFDKRTVGYITVEAHWDETADRYGIEIKVNHPNGDRCIILGFKEARELRNFITDRTGKGGN